MPFASERERCQWAAYAAFVAAKFSLAASHTLDRNDDAAAKALVDGIEALMALGYEVKARQDA